MKRLPVGLLLVALIRGSCAKSAGPSPEFAQAQEKWLSLLKGKANNAYVDPSVDEIIALLSKVNSQSLDANSASTLRQEIESGRGQALARQQDLERQLESANRLARGNGGSDGPTVSVISDQPVESVGPDSNPGSRDAGSPGSGVSQRKAPKVGMLASDFERDFERCFEFKGPALVGGRAGGKVWALKDLLVCRELFPEFATQSVLLMDDRIAAIRSNQELAPKKYTIVDGQLVPESEAPVRPLPPMPSPLEKSENPPESP